MSHTQTVNLSRLSGKFRNGDKKAAKIFGSIAGAASAKANPLTRERSIAMNTKRWAEWRARGKHF